MVLALTILTYFASKSLIRALVMAALGLGLSQIGIDIVTGKTRFTFGLPSWKTGSIWFPW